MVTIRDPEYTDWTVIASLADASVSHVDGAPSQNEWVENRLNFDGIRRHYVAEARGQIVGYGSIEREINADTNAGFRLFLILRWNNPESARIAEEMLAKLQQAVVELEIERVWVREYANDGPFIDFLSSRGFHVTMEYGYGGHRLVNLEATSRFFAA